MTVETSTQSGEKPAAASVGLRPLVYDADRGGHRDRGVALLAKVVAGTALQGPPSELFVRLVGHRGPLLWQTADYALKALLPICILRTLLLRRSILLCYRNDDPSAPFRWRSAIRRCAIGLARRLPLVSVLRIFPPREESDNRCDWIFDPEWWDLAEMPLAIADKQGQPDGRPSILFIGNVSWLKGLEFFTASAEAMSGGQQALSFRLVGNLNTLTEAQRLRLEKAGVELIDGHPTDAEFLGYIQSADFLWCCYAPEYDQSSGVFGRALQLGVPVIVRRGALLEAYMRRFGRGLAVDYGDTAGVLASTRRSLPLVPNPRDLEAMRGLSVGRLRAACGCPPTG